MLNTSTRATLHGQALLATFAGYLFAVGATVGLLVTSATSVRAAAQEHHHYKLIDIGTFGGPNSGTNDGGGGLLMVQILNNQGTFAAIAETPLPDPFAPLCLSGDCFVVHALQWRDGVKTDLGALADGVNSVANWISPNGLIAGASENGQIDPMFPGFPQLRGAFWRHGRITDLGTLPEGGYESFAEGVNSKGQVVGAATNTIPDPFSMGAPDLAGPSFFPAQTRAFLWEDGVMQDLGTLGGTDAMAQFINEKSQVVGWSYTSSAPNTTCPFFLPVATGSYIWDKQNGIRDLGSLGGDCTIATGLNDNGTVVGTYFRDDQTEHAFLWKGGSIIDLGGTLGGDNQGATGINESGEAVGFATFPGETKYHAVIWRQVGHLIDLGVISSDLCSFPTSINSKGQVVGLSQPNCIGEAASNSAFLWENGSMIDLNSLLPSGTTIHLLGGSNINNRGEIGAVGLETSGNSHDVLLIPCDENHPNIEGCDYSLVDTNAATAAQATTEPSDDKLSVAGGQARQALAAAHESNPVRQLLLRRLGSGFTGSVFQVPSDAAGTSGPGATLSPGSLAFSTQAVGTTSAAYTVSLKNTGTTSLSISSIAITGTDAADFAQTHACGSSLAAGASCRISVTFRPTASGSRSATLSVTDNAAGSPQKVSLTGTGTTAQLSPGSLNFGTVTIGVTTPAHTVTLTNAGTTTLTVSGFAITGSNAGDFAQTHTCGSSLAARASCSISVTFKPTVAGTRAALLSVTDNAAASPQKVNLAGIGTTARPGATLSASSLTFGTQLVRTTSPAQSITLANTGTVALFIGSISASTHFAETNNCLPTLASGSSCTISVTFTPAGSGAVAGTLSISDDAAGSPQKVSLSGTGATMTPLLNGYCFATCRGRVQSPVACPAGQEAKTPDFAPVYPCGPIGAGVPVDAARQCRVGLGGFGHCETVE